MPEKTQLPARLLELLGGGALALLGIYKKEVQDGFKFFFSWCWAGTLRWLRRLIREEASAAAARLAYEASLQRLTASLASNLRGLNTLLLLMEKDYQADRVSLTEYELCSDGSGLVSFLTEHRQAEMGSVDNLKSTPLPQPLWLEIRRIPYSDGRALHVRDARTYDSVAVQDAILASGALSAYYQVMPDPSGKYENFTMLSLSWSREHPITKAEEYALHQSGIACSTLLLNRWEIQALISDLTKLVQSLSG